MSTARKVARPLTETELDHLFDLIARSTSRAGLERVIVHVYDRLMSDVGLVYQDCVRVDPTEWAIPEDQAQTLLDAMVVHEGTWTSKPTIHLTWLNIGPSTYSR